MEWRKPGIEERGDSKSFHGTALHVLRLKFPGRLGSSSEGLPVNERISPSECWFRTKAWELGRVVRTSAFEIM